MSIPTELWVTLIIPAVMGVFKAFRFVHEGELGIKLRFGKAIRDKQNKPKVILPGFVWLIPFVDSLKRHHVRQETIRFDHQQVMIKNGLIFDINAIVIFRIKDIYRALFEIENLEFSIEDLGMGILRDQLSLKEGFEELADTEKISQALLEMIRHKAEEWGVEFIQFKLTSCAPTKESANLIFTKVGARFRMEALDEVAKADKNFELDSGLAAVLVGIPLVASANISIQNGTGREQHKLDRATSAGKKAGAFASRLLLGPDEAEIGT